MLLPRPRTASPGLLIVALATCVVVTSLGWWAGRATAPDQQDRFTGVEVLVAGPPSDRHVTRSTSVPAGPVVTGPGVTGPSEPPPSAATTPGSTPTMGILLVSDDPSPSKPGEAIPLPTVSIRSSAGCVSPEFGLGLGFWEIRASVLLSTTREVEKVEAVFTSDGDGEGESSNSPSGTEPMSSNGWAYTRTLPTRPLHFVEGTASWFARVTMRDGRTVDSAPRSHQTPFPC